MRAWLCVALFACSTSADSAPKMAVAPRVTTPPATPAPVAPAPRLAPQTAPHGAEIVTLAATDEGDAVVSVDRVGGIRLWCLLDGTREPVVIQGPAPRSVALGRDGDGFAIGTIDAAGGVQVIQTSAVGALRDRHSVTGDQPAREIESTREGFLVLRADQIIELIGHDGAVRTRLTPDPGNHVESLVARSGRVLAIVREDKQVHGRWIAIDHAADGGARWGEATPALPFAPASAVLSPDGAWLAVSRPRSLHPTLISLATGRAATTPLCVAKAWPHENGEEANEAELMRRDNAPVPLGFLRDAVIACSQQGVLTWWNTGTGVAEDTMVGSISTTNVPSIVTPRGTISGVGASLAISTPSANHYLGYGLHDVSYLRAGASSVLLGGDQQGFIVDDELRERARIELGRVGSEYGDVALIDDRYAVISTIRARGGAHVQLAVFDGLTKTMHQLLPYDGNAGAVRYEASTRLLATTDGPIAQLVRFDPASHTFGAPLRIGNALTTSRLELLDPALTGGVAVLEIDPTADGVLVGELHTDDLVAGTLAQPRASYRVTGELRAVDRAGRLYVRETADAKDIVVYTRGKAGARLVDAAAMTLRPSADGAQIAGLAAPRLALFAADGTRRWDTAHWSASDAAWSPRGALLLSFAAALATVDLSTGALAQRRCGWGFGLTDSPTDGGRSAASICDAAGR